LSKNGPVTFLGAEWVGLDACEWATKNGPGIELRLAYERLEEGEGFPNQNAASWTHQFQGIAINCRENYYCGDQKKSKS